MKPWLETWLPVSDSYQNIIRFSVHGAPFHLTEARAELASAAPEMCRALLVVEYATHRQGGAECPICAEPPGHHHACLIDAALTKAGLPDQESRDAARKEVGI